MKHALYSVSRAALILIVGMGFMIAPLYAQDDAATTFKSKCAVCHGPDGSGNTKMGASLKIPDLRAEVVQKVPDAELTDVITNGKNGKMPAWGTMLKPEEIKALVAHVRTLASKKK